MKKKIYKALKKIFSNFWVRLIGLLVVIAAIFALLGAFESFEAFWQEIIEFITSGDTISLVVVAAVSLIIASFALRGRRYLEESMKVEDDHHKIICKYSGHEKTEPKENNYIPNGAFMYLTNLPLNRKPPRNPEGDRHSSAFKARKCDIEAYMKGKLYLPSVNVYANIAGNAEVAISDTAEKFELPRFVRDNALALMEAHGNSSFSNNVTIRLNDLAVEDGNKLTLKTGRSQYFDMLITNRCMDYKLNDMLSLRDIFESGSKVSPIGESQLGNQIGINGLIFTRDGYLLVEKRGYNKTTWKNKFAQPISLAMKKSDIKCFDKDGKIADSAEKVFKGIILGTIKNNFGLTEENILEFKLSDNLFGIARDLLEGGKPNMYFYVTVNMTAQQLDEFLEEKARIASSDDENLDRTNLPKLPNDKLDSDYYLIRYKDFVINYRYTLSVKARDIIFVKRLYAPRVKKITARLDGGYYRHKCRFNGSIKRECGEALLACLYYAEACKDRLQKETTI
ncbi:MAG: hypothetical protein J1F66_03560 [Clostridiales bacterium]|nr:hypothetical protein [Clostridiales bacterium]